MWHFLNRTFYNANNLKFFFQQIEQVRTASVSGQTSLTKPLPGFNHLQYIDPKSDFFTFKLTTLPNGLRIATEPSFGEYCTLGVAINAGACFEAHYPPGTCHFLEKLAFMKTESFDLGEVGNILEQCGGLVDCQSTKDTFLYASSCHKGSLEQVTKIIADSVLRPSFSDDTLNLAKKIIINENEQLARNPECELLLIDWIHEAAFQGNTIGFSKYCKLEFLNSITNEHLKSYINQFYIPQRMVLAGVGVEHDILVKLGSKYFNKTNTTWLQDKETVSNNLFTDENVISQYTGSELRIERDLSKMALGPTPFPNLAHLVIGFESVSLSHPDFVPFCVLQSLLGGGGSFSAGGPGKGMFTRLYVDVLHHYGWIYNATAYNHSYATTGLFCIRASAPPNKMDKLPKIIIQQFIRLTNLEDIKKNELERAKVQLKSQLLMNFEMRPVMFEDLARQVLAYGYRKKATEYMKAIVLDQVQAEDIVRIGKKMLSSRPALVGYGDLRKLPSYEKIYSYLI